MDGLLRADACDRCTRRLHGRAADERGATGAWCLRRCRMTVMLYLLDTDTASFIIKGRSPEIEARLAEVPPDRVCVSTVIRAELMYGLKRISPSHRLQVGVRA